MGLLFGSAGAHTYLKSPPSPPRVHEYIWQTFGCFVSQAGQAASQGGQETGTHPLKPLWAISLVVVSIGIPSKCSQTSSPRNSTTKCSVRHTWKSWTTASKVAIGVKECLFYCWLASPYFSSASSLENRKALDSKVIPLWSSGWWCCKLGRNEEDPSLLGRWT